MSDPGSGDHPLDEARRAARAGAKPDHDPTLRSEDPQLLEQAVGRGPGEGGGAEGEPAPGRDQDPHPGEEPLRGEDDEDDEEYEGTDGDLGDDALLEDGDDLSPDDPERWAAAEAGSPPAEEVSLAPVAALESLPVFRQGPGLTQPLSARSPERFLAAAVESVLAPGPGQLDGGAAQVTTMQPWAETGSVSGRNKRPLDELLAEYAARVAAAPDARAGVPEGKHPAEAYLERFRSGGGGGRSAGRSGGTPAGGRAQGGGAESGEGRGDRPGRRGRRGRGGERQAETPARTPASSAPGGAGPGRGQGSAGGESPATGRADGGAGRSARRGGGRRRGGQRAGGTQPSGTANGASETRPAGGGRPGQPAGQAGEARGTSSRRRGRGRGRGRGGGDGPRGNSGGTGPGGGGAGAGGGGAGAGGTGPASGPPAA